MKKIRLLLLFSCFCTMFSTILVAKLDKAEIADLFKQGNEFFTQANKCTVTDPKTAKELYRKAAMRFERIVQEGDIHNGKLYYNIGNAYFRMKDLGRAILNYRRAEQYIPNDPNLRQNLEYAREKQFDKIKERQKTRILKTLFFWHYDLSMKTRSIIFILFFIILWFCASVRIYAHKSFMNWFIGISAVISLLFLGSALIETESMRRTHPGVVISSEVIARKGDSAIFEPSFKAPLHAGTECTMLERRGDWYHIKLVDGRSCWAPVKDIEMVR